MGLMLGTRLAPLLHPIEPQRFVSSPVFNNFISDFFAFFTFLLSVQVDSYFSTTNYYVALQCLQGLQGLGEVQKVTHVLLCPDKNFNIFLCNDNNNSNNPF